MGALAACPASRSGRNLLGRAGLDESHDSPPPDAGGADSAPRRFSVRRVLRNTLGLLVAALVIWLAFRGYQQPEMLLDFANVRLC